MLEEDVETCIKVVIVGNGAVGKSSMIQRYCKGIYTRDYKKTIGVDFLEKALEYDHMDIRLMLWDTAGQEEFDAITKAYYRGAQACVIAYSLVDRDSFEAVKSWKKKVENEVGEISTVLVENKNDLRDGSVVSRDEADDLAKEMRLELFRTSVKDNSNVEQVFDRLTQLYFEQAAQEPLEDFSPALISTAELFSIDPTLTSKKVPPPKPPRKLLRKTRDNSTIVLHPSKQRTSGKKATFVNVKCVLT